MLEQLTNHFRPQIAGLIHDTETLKVSIILIPTWMAGNQEFIKTTITEEELGSGSVFVSEFLTSNEMVKYLKELIDQNHITEETAQQFMVSH